MTRPTTGVPSDEKRWLQYYSEEDLRLTVPDMSLSQYIYKCNKDHLSFPALRYFEKTFTYQQLFENIDKASRFFLRLGVKENDYVALAMPLMPEAVFMMYGLDQIGAIANLIDPRVPADRMRFYINLAKVKIGCIVSSYLNTMIEASVDSTLEKIIPVSPIACLNKDEQKAVLNENYSIGGRLKLIAKSVKQNRDIMHHNQHLKNNAAASIVPFNFYDCDIPKVKVAEYKTGKAVVVEYTSGTTGIPKGLELTASGMNTTAAQITQVNRTKPGESLLGIMPPFISYGAVTGIHMSLSAGVDIRLIPKFSVDIFPEIIKKYKPNNIICVPSMFEHVIESELLQNEDLSYMKRLIFGGDRTVPEFEDRVNKWLSDHNAHIRLIKGGGMAEYSSCAFETPFEETKKPGIYGIPLPLVDAKVMKDDYTECGYNEVGEIYISSPQQMRGYINNEEETNAFFFSDENGKKWGRSGDLGFVSPDGTFTLTSRKKQMIVRPDGHNVFPSEIENVIRSCDEADECVVIGIKDKNSVIGEYPVAFIELKKEFSSSPDSILEKIIAKVKQQIPVRDRPNSDRDYIVTRIPYTGEGKIDRTKLKEMYQYKQDS